MSNLITIDYSKVLRRCIHCHHIFQFKQGTPLSAYYTKEVPCPRCGCTAFPHRVPA